LLYSYWFRRKKRQVGVVVSEMIIGAAVAFAFMGLPLGILGLFIASILDRRPAGNLGIHHEDDGGADASAASELAYVQRAGSRSEAAAAPPRARLEARTVAPAVRTELENSSGAGRITQVSRHADR
jgi:hypothetical protein